MDVLGFYFNTYCNFLSFFELLQFSLRPQPCRPSVTTSKEPLCAVLNARPVHVGPQSPRCSSCNMLSHQETVMVVSQISFGVHIKLIFIHCLLKINGLSWKSDQIIGTDVNPIKWIPRNGPVVSLISDFPWTGESSPAGFKSNAIIIKMPLYHSLDASTFMTHLFWCLYCMCLMLSTVLLTPNSLLALCATDVS